MRNERTPRTLAEATFTTGYQDKPIPRNDKVAGVVMAFVVGILSALLLVHGLAS